MRSLLLERSRCGKLLTVGFTTLGRKSRLDNPSLSGFYFTRLGGAVWSGWVAGTIVEGTVYGGRMGFHGIITDSSVFCGAGHIV